MRGLDASHLPSDFVSSDTSAAVGRLLLQAALGRSLVLVCIIFPEIGLIFSPRLLSIVFYLSLHLSQRFSNLGFFISWRISEMMEVGVV